MLTGFFLRPDFLWGKVSFVQSNEEKQPFPDGLLFVQEMSSMGLDIQSVDFRLHRGQVPSLLPPPQSLPLEQGQKSQSLKRETAGGV